MVSNMARHVRCFVGVRLLFMLTPFLHASPDDHSTIGEPHLLCFYYTTRLLNISHLLERQSEELSKKSRVRLVVLVTAETGTMLYN